MDCVNIGAIDFISSNNVNIKGVKWETFTNHPILSFRTAPSIPH